MSKSSRGHTDDHPALRGLTQSERHRLLADARRQRVLDVLADATAPIDLESLATELVAREEALDADYEGMMGRVRIDLHHKHLPLMDGLGVLDYDPDSHRIRTRVSPSESTDAPPSESTDAE